MFDPPDVASQPPSGVALLRGLDRRSEVELALCVGLLREAAAERTDDPVPVVVHGPVAAWEADPAGMTADAAIDSLVAVQAARARLDAAENALLVRAAGRTQVVREVLVEDVDPATGLPFHERDPRIVPMIDEAVDEIAAALHRPVGVVQGQLHVARLLHGPLRATRDALAAGRITLGHATVIADQAARLLAAPLGTDPDADLVFADACAALQDRVLPWAPRETVTECRGRARRVVTAIDPAGAAARRRRAKLHIDVTAKALDDGLALFEAVMPVLEAQAVLAAVDTAARTAISTGTVEALGLGADATLGQVRAAVFSQLMRGEGNVRVEVGVLIDAATLAGITPNGPVYATVGGQPTDASRDDLIRFLLDPTTDATFRRLVTDPLTGALVDYGKNTYAASSLLRRWREAADQHCTHPGCTRPAVRCDVDHTVDYADGGRTTRANTTLRCRRHHNGKTHGGWRIENPDPVTGAHDVISPAGRRYHHEPARLMPETPPPVRPQPPAPDDEDPPF